MHSPALPDAIGAHNAFPTTLRKPDPRGETPTVHDDNADSHRNLPAVGNRDEENVPPDCGTKSAFQLSCLKIVSPESEQHEWTAQANSSDCSGRYVVYHGL